MYQMKNISDYFIFGGFMLLQEKEVYMQFRQILESQMVEKCKGAVVQANKGLKNTNF